MHQEDTSKESIWQQWWENGAKQIILINGNTYTEQSKNEIHVRINPREGRHFLELPISRVMVFLSLMSVAATAVLVICFELLTLSVGYHYQHVK